MAIFQYRTGLSVPVSRLCSLHWSIDSISECSYGPGRQRLFPLGHLRSQRCLTEYNPENIVECPSVFDDSDIEHKDGNEEAGDEDATEQEMDEEGSGDGTMDTEILLEWDDRNK